MVQVEHASPVLIKAEVLAEWLIGSLGHDGKMCVHFTCYLLVSFWCIGLEKKRMADRKLDDRLQTSSIDCPCKTHLPLPLPFLQHARLRSLIPLLFCANFASIVAELLTLHDNCNDLAAVCASTQATFTISWPLAERWMRSSSLFQLYCALTRVGLQVRTTHIEVAWLGYIAPSSATTATRSNFGKSKGEELHRASILCTNWCSSCTQLFYLHACHSGFVCCLCIRLRRNCPALSRRYSTMTRFTQQVLTRISPSRPLNNLFDTLKVFSCASSNHGLAIFLRIFAARLPSPLVPCPQY